MERWSTLDPGQSNEKRKQSAPAEQSLGRAGPHDFRSVMVVDDEPVDLFLAEKVLQNSLGEVTVHKFGNGPDALSMLESAREPGDFPGLIMVDMKMPDMDGETFLKKLQQLKHFNPKKCCVMLLSAHFGYRHGYDIERLSGDFPFVNKCVEKPFKAEMLTMN
jgi:CheY-like chemotaxis protein